MKLKKAANFCGERNSLAHEAQQVVSMGMSGVRVTDFLILNSVAFSFLTMVYIEVITIHFFHRKSLRMYHSMNNRYFVFQIILSCMKCMVAVQEKLSKQISKIRQDTIGTSRRIKMRVKYTVQNGMSDTVRTRLFVEVLYTKSGGLQASDETILSDVTVDAMLAVLCCMKLRHRSVAGSTE